MLKVSSPKFGKSYAKLPPDRQLSKAIDVVTSGNLRKVQKYINCGFNINQMDAFGRTVTFYACIAGNDHIVQYLVHDLQANINLVDGKGQGILHWMAQAGRISIPTLEILCSHGINLNVKDDDGETEFTLACGNKNADYFLRTLCMRGLQTKLSKEDVDKAMSIAKDLGPTWNKKVQKIFDDTGISSINNDSLPITMKKQFEGIVTATIMDPKRELNETSLDTSLAVEKCETNAPEEFLHESPKWKTITCCSYHLHFSCEQKSL